MLLGEDWKACTTLGAMQCDPVSVVEINVLKSFHPSPLVQVLPTSLYFSHFLLQPVKLRYGNESEEDAGRFRTHFPKKRNFLKVYDHSIFRIYQIKGCLRGIPGCIDLISEFT